MRCLGFLKVPVVKNPLSNARDVDLIPGLGRSPGGVLGYPLQYSCLENSAGQRSLVGFSPWSCKEWNMTKQLSVHTGSPLKQFSWQIVTLGIQLILRRVKGEKENNLTVHCLNSKYKFFLLREMEGLILPSAMLSSLVKL